MNSIEFAKSVAGYGEIRYQDLQGLSPPDALSRAIGMNALRDGFIALDAENAALRQVIQDLQNPTFPGGTVGL